MRRAHVSHLLCLSTIHSRMTNAYQIIRLLIDEDEGLLLRNNVGPQTSSLDIHFPTASVIARSLTMILVLIARTRFILSNVYFRLEDGTEATSNVMCTGRTVPSSSAIWSSKLTDPRKQSSACYSNRVHSEVFD